MRSFAFIEDRVNAKRETEQIDSIPIQNVVVDAFQLLRAQTDSVPKDCLEAYCGSRTDLGCPQQQEFKEYDKLANKDEYEKRLDELVSGFVSKAFAEFRLDSSLPTIRAGDKKKFGCDSKARDFFLLEDLKTKFSQPVTKKKFFPGSLLRWLFVHSAE